MCHNYKAKFDAEMISNSKQSFHGLIRFFGCVFGLSGVDAEKRRQRPIRAVAI